MTTFVLIRHASHDWLGNGLAGRTAGVALNRQGREEAGRLAKCLAEHGLDTIYSSPTQRARETAEAMAIRSQRPLVIEPALDEVDFGAWSGRAFDSLRDDPEWLTWVHKRSAAQPPGGESIGAVQFRAVSLIERLLAEHSAAATLALVSHGDVIKSVLARYLAIPLDALERFEIAPASFSVLEAGPGWSRVKLVNGAPGLHPGG